MRKVIDTNIWIKAVDATSESFMDCSLFISNFLQNQNDYLAMDYEMKIFEEYNDNLRNNNSFQKYIMELHRLNKITYCSSRIAERYKKGLDRVGFHEEEDRIFLGTAMNADKYLVTEDSDYGCSLDENKNDEAAKSKRQYIEEIMGVTLRNGKQAKEDSRLIKEE